MGAGDNKKSLLRSSNSPQDSRIGKTPTPHHRRNECLPLIIFLHTTKTFHFLIWFEFVLEGFFKSFQRPNSIICSKLSKYFSKKRHWLKFSIFWLRNFSHNQPLLHVSVLAQPTISAIFSQLDQRIIPKDWKHFYTHTQIRIVVSFKNQKVEMTSPCGLPNFFE